MAVVADRPEARAVLKHYRRSAYKTRQVLDLVRGLPVDEARRTLRFSERGASVELLKLLDSAISNAEHNLQIAADELKIVACYADEGPTLKRWRPRARGRATRIRKRTCHVTIVVARLSDEELTRRARAEEGTGRADRRRRVLASRKRERPEAHDHDHDHGDHEHGDHEHDDGHEPEEAGADASAGTEDEVAATADTEAVAGDDAEEEN